MLTRQVHGSGGEQYKLGSDPAAATYAKLECIVGDRGGPPRRHEFGSCLVDVMRRFGKNFEHEGDGIGEMERTSGRTVFGKGEPRSARRET